LFVTVFAKVIIIQAAKPLQLTACIKSVRVPKIDAHQRIYIVCLIDYLLALIKRVYNEVGATNLVSIRLISKYHFITC
jgi:hypothetical protein